MQIMLALAHLALDNGIGHLPVRGVSSWCVQGACGWDRCWDAEFRSLADAMMDQGLGAAGYEYLHIDGAPELEQITVKIVPTFLFVFLRRLLGRGPERDDRRALPGSDALSARHRVARRIRSLQGSEAGHLHRRHHGSVHTRAV